MDKPGAHIRILVVDHSTTVRSVARRTLESAGYQVAVADDGPAGLEAAQTFVPDLVLIDSLLPGLDGESFCRALRGISNLRQTAVVLMSARADRIAESFMEATGAVDAISKPFAPESLLAVTIHALGREGAVSADPFANAESLNARERERRADGVAQALADALVPLYPDARAALTSLPIDERLAIAERIGAVAFGGDAALRGRMPDVELGDVLQLLQSADGILHVEDGAGRAVQICLGMGKVDLVLARGGPPEFLLGRYLLHDNLLDPADLDAHLSRASRGKGRLGEQLVRLGYISREDLQHALMRQSSELIYEALRWPRGRFAFVRFAHRPEARQAALQLPITSMLMEGLRRVDEWRLIEEQVRSFDIRPNVDARAARELNRDAMRDEERRVLDAIDGKRTVRDIVEETRLASFDVCKVLFQLMSARVVR